MTHPNGTTFEHTLEYANDKEYDFTLIRGVRITYPDGTKRWISDTWYDEETLKELFAR